MLAPPARSQAGPCVLLGVIHYLDYKPGAQAEHPICRPRHILNSRCRHCWTGNGCSPHQGVKLMHRMPCVAYAVHFWSPHYAAALLLQIGVPCKVLERDPGPRKGGSAIGLWPNAFRALDALGVADSLRQKHPLISRQVSLNCQHSNIWQHSMTIYVISRPYMDALDRLFWRNKTRPACTQLRARKH